MRQGVALISLVVFLLMPFSALAQKKPVYIAVDGAFGVPKSTSAQSIEKGVRIAVHEINKAGGVLGGRPMEVITTDNRSMPARGIQNVKKLAANPDLVAVVSGRFSPVVIETLDALHENKLINLAA